MDKAAYDQKLNDHQLQAGGRLVWFKTKFPMIVFKDLSATANKVKSGLVLTSAAVGAGHRACPNEGNHRGIAPTKNGPQYNQANSFHVQVSAITESAGARPC